MKVALVLGSLGCGGAERVMSCMANYWARKGWSVAMITLSSAETDFFKLNPLVRRIALDVAKPSTNVLVAGLRNIHRAWRLRRTLQQLEPRAVISFLPPANVLTIFASIRLSHSVIISERAAPTHFGRSAAWSILRGFVYARADCIVPQTARVAAWLNEHLLRVPIAIIPNPVDVRPMPRRDALTTSPLGLGQTGMQTLLAIGRLGRQKGFDLLIRAFSQLRYQFDGWKLVILGEGPERPNLEALIGNLMLKDYVSLPGRVADTEAFLRQADVFVLSSRYEGMPNVLMEALAHGVPAVSFDCPTGPRELIRDGENGILVPAEDVDGLISAMARVMRDAALRERLSSAARKSMQSFQPEVVMGQWEELLETIGKKTGQSRKGMVCNEP